MSNELETSSESELYDPMARELIAQSARRFLFAVLQNFKSSDALSGSVHLNNENDPTGARRRQHDIDCLENREQLLAIALEQERNPDLVLDLQQEIHEVQQELEQARRSDPAQHICNGESFYFKFRSLSFRQTFTIKHDSNDNTHNVHAHVHQDSVS